MLNSGHFCLGTRIDVVKIKADKSKCYVVSRFKFSANRIIFTGFFEKSVLNESAFNRSLMFFKEWLKVFNAA